jgi:hypothetical protein
MENFALNYTQLPFKHAVAGCNLELELESTDPGTFIITEALLAALNSMPYKSMQAYELVKNPIPLYAVQQ